MHYHAYYDVDVINGPGTRCTLFVAGCEHRCEGCYNASTWNPESGQPFDEAMVNRILTDLNDTRIPRSGLSLSGGDPLLPANCGPIGDLCRRVKDACPEKSIWLWTGYVLESLTPEQKSVLQSVDVLIDGPFIQAQADPSHPFRGSSNQRIFHLCCNLSSVPTQAPAAVD